MVCCRVLEKFCTYLVDQCVVGYLSLSKDDIHVQIYHDKCIEYLKEHTSPHEEISVYDDPQSFWSLEHTNKKYL